MFNRIVCKKSWKRRAGGDMHFLGLGLLSLCLPFDSKRAISFVNRILDGASIIIRPFSGLCLALIHSCIVQFRSELWRTNKRFIWLGG